MVRRKRTGAAGGKETKVRQSRKAETVSQDIQEELTEKLETLLERDRPEVRIHSLIWNLSNVFLRKTNACLQVST